MFQPVSNLDVLVLGDANPDLVLSGTALGAATGQREVVVDDATMTVGGSGAIAACGLARLGRRVGFAGVVGDDVFGRFMEERLLERSIDVAPLIRRAQPTGISVVLSSPGDRGIYTFPGTIAALGPADVREDVLAGARHVHVSSFFLQDALRPGLAALLERARSFGATTSLDPNWDPAERWDDGLLDALAHVDVFLPNEAEVTRIARTDDVEAAASSLADRAGSVVVKRGAEGALAVREGVLTRAPAAAADVVETTGAGDSFDAGYLHAFLEGWSVGRALAFANACGALSGRAAGGVEAQATLEEAFALAGPA
jgi:sugar/nucleoside kinase (ribokinase family)